VGGRILIWYYWVGGLGSFVNLLHNLYSQLGFQTFRLYFAKRGRGRRIDQKKVGTCACVQTLSRASVVLVFCLFERGIKLTTANMVSLGEVRCELSHVNNACSSSCILTIFLGFSLGDLDHWISCMSVEVLQKKISCLVQLISFMFHQFCLIHFSG
jgi:hypothetical protein